MSDVEDIGAQMAAQGLEYFTVNILYTAVAAIGSIAVARLLGPEGYGIYSLSLVIPSMLVMFTNAGIGVGLIKYVSSYAANRDYLAIRSFYLSALIFRLSTGILIALFILLFADHLSTAILNRPEVTFYVKMLSIIVIFQALTIITISFLVGYGLAGKSSFLNLLAAIIKFPAAILLIIVGFSVLGAILGHIFGYTIASIAGLFYVLILLFKHENRGGNLIGHSITIYNALKMMLSYGSIIYLATLFVTFSGHYINIILAWFVSNVEIGGFNVSNQLTTSITIFLIPISIVLFPSFSMINARGSSALPQAFKRAIRYSILFVIPVAVFVSTFSEHLTLLIYGREYLFAAEYLRLLALTFLIQPLLNVSISYFNGVGLNTETLKAHAIYFLIILASAPLLTMFFRVNGVVLSILTAYLLSTIYSLYRCSSLKLPIDVKYIVKLYLATIFVGIISSLFRLLTPLSHPETILILIFGGIFYLTILFIVLTILDIPTEDDINFIQRYFTNIRLIGPIVNILIKYIRSVRSHLKHGV